MSKAKKAAERPIDEKVEPPAVPATAEGGPDHPLEPGATPVASEAAKEVSPAVVPPDYKDLYLRALAELDNFRKVTARERRTLIDSAGEGVLRKLLDPADGFDRAVAELERIHLEAPETLKPLLQRSVEGLKGLQRQINTVLSTEGVERLVPRGAAFDPLRHEAVARIERTDAPDGTVIDVVQPGYALKGTLLRPARVVVAAHPADKIEKAPEKEENT